MLGIVRKRKAEDSSSGWVGWREDFFWQLIISFSKKTGREKSSTSSTQTWLRWGVKHVKWNRLKYSVLVLLLSIAQFNKIFLRVFLPETFICKLFKQLWYLKLLKFLQFVKNQESLKTEQQLKLNYIFKLSNSFKKLKLKF